MTSRSLYVALAVVTMLGAAEAHAQEVNDIENWYVSGAAGGTFT